MPDFAAIAKLMEALCSLPPTWVELADVLKASPFEAEQTLDLLSEMETLKHISAKEVAGEQCVWVNARAAINYHWVRYERAKRGFGEPRWMRWEEYLDAMRLQVRFCDPELLGRLPEDISENVEQALEKAVKQADLVNRPPKRTLASYAAGAWYEHPLGPGDILRLERARKARMNGHYKPANWSYCAQCGGMTRWDTGCLMCLGKVVAQ